MTQILPQKLQQIFRKQNLKILSQTLGKARRGAQFEIRQQRKGIAVSEMIKTYRPDLTNDRIIVIIGCCQAQEDPKFFGCSFIEIKFFNGIQDFGGVFSRCETLIEGKGTSNCTEALFCKKWW